MKNKKGFTLIEIIGAVIILGIIAIIAFNTFVVNIREFRDDYYNSLVKTFEESGKEFFNDNRSYRPGGILGAQKVSIGMLESKGYVDEAIDYRNHSCEKNSSYVIVIKEGRDKYSYHTCLKCPGDDYDNTQDNKYCDSAWLDPGTIYYGIGDSPNIFVYKGTSRDKLRELLEIPVSYVRKNNAGEVLETVRGTPEEGLPTILPKNIDVVDTNKTGVYEVIYEFKPVRSGVETGELEIVPGSVTVYENERPGIAITYNNVIAKGTALLGAIAGGETDTESGIYTEGRWAQSITITLNGGSLIDANASIEKYQWNKDGRWQDFCESNGSCSVTLNKDMNETVRFRTIDSNGHISQVTDPIEIKRDDTSPYCVINGTGTEGTNGWYTSDVDIEFTDNRDLSSGTYAAAISGIDLNNLNLSTEALDRTNSSTTFTHTANTTGVTYIGYVEDKAKNYTTCEFSLKKDDVTPSVTIVATKKGDGTTVATDTWVNDGLNFTLTVGTTGVSGYTIYYCKDTANTCNPSLTATSGTAITSYNTTSGIYYIRYKIVSGAGLSSEVGSFKAKVDISPPTCSFAVTNGTAGTSPWYTSNSMTVTATFADDGGSEPARTGTSDSATPTYNSQTTYTLSTNENGKVVYCYVEDTAGNKGSNSITLYKDNVTPTVTITATKKTAGTTVASGAWSNQGLNFTLTAGTRGVSGYTIYYCKDTANTCNPTTSVGSGTPITDYNSIITDYYIRYKIVSGAGLSSSVGSYRARIDTYPPICRLDVYTGTLGTEPWYKSDTVSVTATIGDSGGSQVSELGTTDSTTVTYNMTDTYILSDNAKNKTIYTYIKDGAGNENVCSIVLNKDNVTPTVTITAIKKTAGTYVLSGVWSDQGLNFKLTAGTTGLSGYTIYYCQDTANTCNPTTTASSGDSITTYNTTTGIYYIRYKIVSGAGLSSSVGSYKAMVDTTGPSCNITGPSSTGWTNSSVNLSVSGNDPGGSGLDSQPYSWTSSTSGFSTTASYSATVNGTYTAYVRDVAGNVTSCQYTVSNIDKSRPSCALSVTSGTSGSNGWYKSASVTVTATFNDSGSGVLSKGTTTSTTATYNANTTYTIDSNTTGTTIYCYVKDGAGNTGSNSIVIKKDDASGASCSATGGNSSWISAAQVDISGRLNNAPISGCQEWDEGSSSVSSNCTYRSYVNINEGEEKKTYSDGSNGGFSFTTKSGVSIVCRNNTWNIYSDRKNPTCQISASGSSPSVTLTVSGTDTGSGLAASPYSWTSGTSGFGSTTTKTVTANGTYSAWVKDAVGNVGSCSYSVTTIITNCPAGQYLSAGICVTCPAGHYCTGGTNVTECPSGTYRTATGGKTVGDCTKCAAGTTATGYTGQTSSSRACKECPRGLYCTGGANLDYCPSGTYGREAGLKAASECTPCPYPKVGNGINGATTEDAACKTCATGTYYDNAQCKTCLANYYCPNPTSLTQCPDGYSSPAGSTLKSQCVISCEKGYRVGQIDKKCIQKCPNGMTHSAHNVSAGSTSSSCEYCPWGDWSSGEYRCTTNDMTNPRSSSTTGYAYENCQYQSTDVNGCQGKYRCLYYTRSRTIC